MAKYDRTEIRKIFADYEIVSTQINFREQRLDELFEERKRLDEELENLRERKEKLIEDFDTVIFELAPQSGTFDAQTSIPVDSENGTVPNGKKIPVHHSGERRNTNMAKNLIDDVHAMKLKFYAEQWQDADKKLSDIHERISQIESFCREKIFPLQLEEVKLLHEKRVAEIEMSRIILAQIESRTPAESVTRFNSTQDDTEQKKIPAATQEKGKENE